MGRLVLTDEDGDGEEDNDENLEDREKLDQLENVCGVPSHYF
jgi:hypothetical protein